MRCRRNITTTDTARRSLRPFPGGQRVKPDNVRLDDIAVVSYCDFPISRHSEQLSVDHCHLCRPLLWVFPITDAVVDL